MCAVSQMVDYGMNHLTPDHLKNSAIRDRFQELINYAKEFDKEAEQPDCPSKDKTDWLLENGFYY